MLSRATVAKKIDSSQDGTEASRRSLGFARKRSKRRLDNDDLLRILFSLCALRPICQSGTVSTRASIWPAGFLVPWTVVGSLRPDFDDSTRRLVFPRTILPGSSGGKRRRLRAGGRLAIECRQSRALALLMNDHFARTLQLCFYIVASRCRGLTPRFDY